MKQKWVTERGEQFDNEADAQRAELVDNVAAHILGIALRQINSLHSEDGWAIASAICENFYISPRVIPFSKEQNPTGAA